MKKIGAAAAMAAMTIVVAALCGVALADDGHGTKPDKQAEPPKAAIHDSSTDQPKPDNPESASKPQDQKPSEPEAKVYICHATGSQSNPYVLIHVSSHALKAHTSHQDGRDIVLGASLGTCPGASTTSDVKVAEHSNASNESAPKVKESDENEANEANESSEANDSENSKVFICHATGSDSNPFVLIHVSEHAVKAHTSHQDGRDIVLGSTPGTCPGASTSSNTAEVQGVEATSCTSDDNDQAKQHDDNGQGDDKNGQDRDQKAKAAKSDHEDNDDDDNCPAAASSSSSASQLNLSAVSASNNVSSNTASSLNTSATSSNTAATSNAASTPTGSEAGVLGAVKALSAPAAPVLSAQPNANAGVLGTLAKIPSAATSGTLPFSGIRLWIFELVALGLIGLGVATRMLVRRRPN
jgi:hypothetical protein